MKRAHVRRFHLIESRDVHTCYFLLCIAIKYDSSSSKEKTRPPSGHDIYFPCVQSPGQILHSMYFHPYMVFE